MNGPMVLLPSENVRVFVVALIRVVSEVEVRTRSWRLVV